MRKPDPLDHRACVQYQISLRQSSGAYDETLYPYNVPRGKGNYKNWSNEQKQAKCDRDRIWRFGTAGGQNYKQNQLLHRKGSAPIAERKKYNAGKKGLPKANLQRTPIDAEREDEEIARSVRSGQGFGLSAAERREVERHAMTVAKQHYERQGYKVVDTHTNHPYDYRCDRDGKCLYLEVKGTTDCLASVYLTRGEVEHARENAGQCALFVIYDISLNRKGKKASGGKQHILYPWRITPNALTPLLYKYDLQKK